VAETQTPDYQSQDFQRFCPLWDKVDACLGGTEAMRAAGGGTATKFTESPYLPQFPMEHDESYLHRLETSTFLPAYGAGLDNIVGAITRKPPTLTETVPPAIAADWENIDNASGSGGHWVMFAQRLLRTGIHHGAAYVLVDMPKKPVAEGEIMDRAQTAAVNFRPFTVLYSARELANWPRYVVIDGAPVLQLIVFCEKSVELDDFGEVCTDRYRVWRLPVEKDELGNYRRAGNATWEIWEEQEIKTGKKKKTELAIIDSGVSPLSDIPVAIFNANPCLTDPQRTDGPVLLDLANENIKHYQITSDHEKILHKCAPILTTTNLKDENGLAELAGLDVRLDCGPEGGAQYVEPPATSLQARQEWIAGLEKHLHEMGASLFAEGSQKGAMTATEVRERGGAKQSRVSQIADAWHDCLETMLGFFALWKGEETGGEITLGVRLSDLVVTPADLPALSQMVERRQHSRKTLYAVEKKMGLLQDDFDDDAEIDQIAEEEKLIGSSVLENFQQTFDRGPQE
jgi:hypothetical protein